jgi:DNA-3-methyladenine glycosylase
VLGARLVREDARGRRVGRIVEVEAYIGPGDLASHARFGPTDRNRAMFGPPGIAYVYLVYGMYHCLNVVTEPAGRAAALLIRAVEPIEGEAAMRAAPAPGRDARRIRTVPTARLAAGPGLVGVAFDITRADDLGDLCDPSASLRLEPGEPAEIVATTPRIGIGYAPEPWLSHPWRFILPTSPSLSRARR